MGCADVNECAMRSVPLCGDNAACVNLHGGNNGETIMEGFTLVRVNSIDENEREVMNFCHKYANCVNTDVWFTCKCKAGFQGDDWLLLLTGETVTGYVNIKECNESPCDANVQCANNIGSYTCTCCNDYSGDGHFCVDINEFDAALSNGDRKRRDSDGNFIPTELCHADADCINQDGINHLTVPVMRVTMASNVLISTNLLKVVITVMQVPLAPIPSVVILVHVIPDTKVMVSVVLILMNVSIAHVMATETVATMLDHTHVLAMMDLMVTVKPVLISMSRRCYLYQRRCYLPTSTASTAAHVLLQR